MQTELRGLLLLIASLTLGACELDSSSSSGAREPLEGRAVKGIVQNATVSAYSREGAQWAFADVVYTNEQGEFVFTDGLPSGPLKVVLQAAADGSSRMICDAASGCGAAGLDSGDLNANGVFDFGESMPLPSDFSLTTIIAGDRPRGSVIALTPLTHLAAVFVDALPGEVSDQAIAVAQAQVSLLFAVPGGFAYESPLAVTDPTELDGADTARLNHALVAAAFAEMAAGGDIQLIIDAVAAQFSGLSAQLPVVGDSSLGAVLAAAEQVRLRVEAQGVDLSASGVALQEQAARWTGTHTGAAAQSEFDPEDLARARTTLDELDHYLSLAGIDESGSFLAAQAGQLEWLYNTETQGLVQSVAQVAAPLMMIAVMEDVIATQYDTEVLDLTGLIGYGDEVPTVLFDTGTRELSISGRLTGQTVDIVVQVAKLTDEADGGILNYAVEASVGNSLTSAGLNGTLTMDLYDSNTLPTVLALHAVALGTGSYDEFEAEVRALLPLLQIRATIGGAAHLVKTEDPSFGFSGSLTASAELDMPALPEGAPVVTVTIVEGEFTSPAGDTLYTLDHAQGLQLEIGADEVHLAADFGLMAFGMPAMEVSASGGLEGFETLLTHLAAAVEGDTSVGMDDLLSTVSQLDLSVLEVYGKGSLHVPADGKTWYFGLQGNRFDVSLPNSVAAALSFHLTAAGGGYVYSGSSLVGLVTVDLARLGVSIHFVDGEARSYFLGSLEDLDPTALALLVSPL